MHILVVGGTGATGRLLVEELLSRDAHVRTIARSPEKLPDRIREHSRLSLVHATLLDLSDAEMARAVEDCDAVASCLGHTMSFKGIFAPPRRLVTDATRRLCSAIKSTAPPEPVKFILMNTVGNQHRDLDESVSLTERTILGLLYLLLPPHTDNVEAAEYLRTEIGQQDPCIEWAAVRPDTLIDHDEVTPYDIHPSPTQSALFGSGETSRINVGHFMADLITNDEVWTKWNGQMPVIYNRNAS